MLAVHAMTLPNAPQREYWSQLSGPKWVALQPVLDELVGPAGRLALEAARVQPGERVLDVGCGCGHTALDLAEQVGPRGRVVGVDLSVPMLARARERVAEAGSDRIELREADAQAVSLGERFDLVFSRFGVMFFESPEAAFRNLREHVDLWGRLVFTCWQALEVNPWMEIPLRATERVLGLQAPPPTDDPGPFALAREARIRAILADAGWADVECDARKIDLQLASDGGTQAAADLLTRLGPGARLLAEAPTEHEKVARAIADAIRGHETAEGVRLPGAIWIVRATCPPSEHPS